MYHHHQQHQQQQQIMMSNFGDQLDYYGSDCESVISDTMVNGQVSPSRGDWSPVTSQWSMDKSVHPEVTGHQSPKATRGRIMVINKTFQTFLQVMIRFFYQIQFISLFQQLIFVHHVSICLVTCKKD